MARDESMRGAFVWYDLMTRDVEAAKAYYTETVGWGTQPWEGGEKPYTMFTVAGRALGGVAEMPPELEGVPPHWLGYVAVPDVDASAAKVKELGGDVMHGPADIPKVGRFAVITDPQGAAVALFTPAEGSSQEPIERSATGNFSWAELNTTDWEGAWTFYSALLGWSKTSAMEMGDAGTYQMFQRAGGPEGQSMGGMSSVAAQMKMPAHWLFYVNVDGIDEACERVRRNGGKVVNGPMDVPGDAKIAQCLDSEGAAFAIYAEKG